MTIEILEIKTEYDNAGLPISRFARLSIDGWDLPKGGLPLAGDLQTILNAQEIELLALAIARNQALDVWKHAIERVAKAFALVALDEFNIVRAAVIPPLPARTAGQIETAIKNKLKTL